MGTLPTEHTERVKKFIREEDRKRGLISRLLQFAACREVYGMAQEDIVIKRTKVGVPRGASSSAKRVGSSTIFCRRVFAEAFFAPRLPLTSRPAPSSRLIALRAQSPLWPIRRTPLSCPTGTST